jgi:hypothetical protein
MSIWFLGIVIWVCAGTLITFLTRRTMARYYIEALKIRDEASDSDPYQRGFKDGVMGIKMYYTILEKMPDSHWVLTNCMKRLDTREKLLETLSQEELETL